MRTTLEREGPTVARLAVEVEPGEVEPLYRKTLQRLAQEVKIPGFRRGKVPRPVLESKVGKEAIREEVLHDALPELFARAAAEQGLAPIASPEIEVVSYAEGGALTFNATVEVRPEIELPEYRGVEVERPPTEATEEEIGEQLDRLRDRFGTLEAVARPAGKGDHVLIDLKAYRHAEQIDAASAKDLLYEVGSNSLVPEIDEELEGKRTGDILKVNATLPERFGPPHGGEEVSFSILVKDVHAKRLPDLDDEFARTASEFDTLEDLKAELRRRIETFKGLQAQVELRERIVEDILDRTEVPVPESMLRQEMQRRLAGLIRDLERHGMTLPQYLEQAGLTEEQLVEGFRQGAERAVAADLVLEAIAEAEGIEVSDEELDAEVVRLAGRLGRDAESVARELEQSGRVETLAGDILRRKALDLLVESAGAESAGVVEKQA